jgi:phenylpyruvate tautomerase PptA (4-oxalocrotonate tautomerase family)
MVFFERAFFSLQRAESESFISGSIVEVITEFFVNGAHEGEKEGVQVSSREVSGGNWGQGKDVED